MTPERWQQVRDVLHEAMQLRPEERPAYLDRWCADDDDLRKELRELLDVEQGLATDFLESLPQVEAALDRLTALAATKSELATSNEPLLGRRVGSYRIVEEIGSGGMGEVYRAVRADDQYRKQVALKLVRPGQGSQFVFERFRRERQILASLDHPNIARLLDGGTTEEGAPYFVMELIEGQPLGQYCDERKLGINDRLRLFLQVCSAVQFAHQRLVVHRDIKPSNILVTVDGTPKLLDFGVSKILEEDSELAQFQQTLTIFRALTPAYASPEQIKGEPITTASDVYSLGVVLYELLTGRTPYPTSTRTPHEISIAVCEVEPERPSTAVRKDLPEGDGSPRRESSANVPSAKLDKQLRGDLDSIVLKALRKETKRRYASVEDFAGDLRRHLEHLPVVARKGTASYRAAKFLRRHRAGLAVAGTFAILLIAGIAMIVREARLAERRFNDVRKLANSVIFELPRPIHSLPGAVTVEKTLYASGLKYLDGLASEAGGDVSLQRELAAGYKQLADSLGSPYAANLGDAVGARAAYVKALEMRERIAKNNPDSVPDQLELAKLYRTVGYQSYLSGDVAAGHNYVHKALGISQPIANAHDDNIQALGESSVDLFTAGNIDGEAWDNGFFGDPDIALTYHFESAKIAQRLASRQQATDMWIRQTIFMFTAIAWDYVASGRPAQAIDSAQKASGMLNNLHPSDPVGIAAQAGERSQIHSLLGRALLLSGRGKEAASEWKSAFPFYQQLYDPQDFRSRETLAGAYAGWGHAEVIVGDTTSGLKHIRQGLDLLEAGTAPDSEKEYSPALLAQVYSYQGEALEQQGNLSEALVAYNKALDRFHSPLLSKFPHAGLLAAVNLAAIARALARSGKNEQARTEYQEAMRLVEPAAASKAPNLYAQCVLFDVYSGLGDLALQSRGAGNSPSNSQKDACGWFRKGMDVWQHLPAHLAATPNGLRMTDFKSIAAQLAKCRH